MSALIEMDQSSGDEVDRDDPLLITKVRARLKREEKVKKVGRKTVKRLVDIRGGDEENAGEKEEEQARKNPRRYICSFLKAENLLALRMLCFVEFLFMLKLLMQGVGICRYQQEAFNEALRKNIILYLETGGGKTLVAVLLIKALAKSTRLETDKRLIVFLAPTVLLVKQVHTCLVAFDPSMSLCVLTVPSPPSRFFEGVVTC